MTSSTLLYLLIGNTILILAYSAIPEQRRPDMRGLKGVTAFLLGSLFWPIAIITIWYDQQRECWAKGQLGVKQWLREKENGGKYVWGRITLIIRYPPRKILRQANSWTFLIRPRPSLKSLVLLSPNALHLNFIACQIIIVQDLP